MDNKDFAKLLKRLKDIKVSNAEAGRYFGFSATSICHFANGKRPLPLVLIRACEGLQRIDSIGIDLKNIILKDKRA